MTHSFYFYMDNNIKLKITGRDSKHGVQFNPVLPNELDEVVFGKTCDISGNMPVVTIVPDVDFADHDKEKVIMAKHNRYRKRGLRSKKKLTREEQYEFARKKRLQTGTEFPRVNRKMEQRAFGRDETKLQLQRSGVEPNPGSEACKLSGKDMAPKDIQLITYENSTMAVCVRCKSELGYNGKRKHYYHKRQKCETLVCPASCEMDAIQHTFGVPTTSGYAADEPIVKGETVTTTVTTTVPAPQEQLPASRPVQDIELPDVPTYVPVIVPEQLLDGVRPEITALSKGLAMLGYKGESTITVSDVLLGEDNVPNYNCKLSYTTTAQMTEDRRLLIDRVIPLVNKRVVVGLWEFDTVDSNWRQWLCGRATCAHYNVMFCPHLVSQALHETPNNNNLETLKANMRQRILRGASGVALTDRLVSDVIAGSEIVAIVMASNQLNFTIAPVSNPDLNQWLRQGESSLELIGGRLTHLGTGLLKPNLSDHNQSYSSSRRREFCRYVGLVLRIIVCSLLGMYMVMHPLVLTVVILILIAVVFPNVYSEIYRSLTRLWWMIYGALWRCSARLILIPLMLCLLMIGSLVLITTSQGRMSSEELEMNVMVADRL